MSAQTISAIHDAIAAHAADAGKDGVVTEWAVVFTTQSIEDDRAMWNYDYTTSSMGSPHGTLGLVSALDTLVQESIWDADDD